MNSMPALPRSFLLCTALLLALAQGAGAGETSVDYDVYRAWDFTAPGKRPDAGWRVAGGEAGGFDARGVTLRQVKNGPILRNQALRFRALDVSACAVKLGIAYDTAGGIVQAAPRSVRLYWARQADVGRGSNWPFDGSRSVALEAVAGDPGVYRGDMGTHGNWIGTIRDAFIEVHGPAEAQGRPWRVAVESIAFLSERQPPASPVPAESTVSADTTTKNGAPRRVIFVLIDTLRADHLGYMGYDRDTSPYLDALSKHAANFRFTIAHGDGTVYSMPAIFTGKFYSQLYQDPPWEAGLLEENITLGELFRDAGFRTLGWSTNPHVSKRTHYDQGFDNFHELWPSGVIYSRIEHVIRAIRQTYRESRGKEFLYVHLMDVHHPYAPPAPFCDLWAKPYGRKTFRDGSMRAFDGKEAIGLQPYWAESSDVQAADIRQALSQYDGEIRYVNAYFPDLLSALNYRPEEDLLVVTADHGEQFYEHGFIGHNKSTLIEEIHVPLLIRYPGLDARTVETPVGLSDILPTLCDIYGMPVPGGARGRSLLPALRGETLAAVPLFSEASPRRGDVGVMVSDGWLYYLNLRANAFTRPWDPWPIRQLLYHLDQDPACQTNLAAREPERLAAMNRLLRAASPRFEYATPDALPARPKTLSFLPSPPIVLPGDSGPLRAIPLVFTTPGRQHLLEVDYTLESGPVRLEGVTAKSAKPFFTYAFYKARPEKKTFQVVITPSTDRGTLRFDTRQAKGFHLVAIRCRPIVSPVVPVKPWPGSARAADETEALSEEELQRLEALGYVQ